MLAGINFHKYVSEDYNLSYPQHLFPNFLSQLKSNVHIQETYKNGGLSGGFYGQPWEAQCCNFVWTGEIRKAADRN
jgi:hypothetical protein